MKVIHIFTQGKNFNRNYVHRDVSGTFFYTITYMSPTMFRVQRRKPRVAYNWLWLLYMCLTPLSMV